MRFIPSESASALFTSDLTALIALVVAGFALAVSAFGAYWQFIRRFDSLFASILSADVRLSNTVQEGRRLKLVINFSIANIGTNAAIVSRIIAIAPSNAGGHDSGSSVFAICRDSRLASLLDPVLLESGKLEVIHTLFDFDATALSIPDDFRVPIKIHFELVDRFGKTVSREVECMNVFIEGGNWTGTDLLMLERTILLPKPNDDNAAALRHI